MDTVFADELDRKLKECADYQAEIEVLLYFEKNARISDENVQRSLFICQILITKIFTYYSVIDIITFVNAHMKKRNLSTTAAKAAMKKSLEIVLLNQNARFSSTDTKQLLSMIIENCQGKVFCEEEYLLAVFELLKILKSEQLINDAFELVQKIQLETFTSIDKKLKTEYMLEQLQVFLMNKDYAKAKVASNKISQQYFSKYNDMVMYQ